MDFGRVVVFEGAAPPMAEVRRFVAAHLALVPRARQTRQRRVFCRGTAWIDDPDFQLDYHIRHVGLPAPGGAAHLLEAVDQIFAPCLDPAKSLWELWVIEALAGPRWALAVKAHGALVEPRSGSDGFRALCGSPLSSRAVNTGDCWLPRPRPTDLQLAAEDVAVAFAGGVTQPVWPPKELLRTSRRLAEASAAPLRAAGTLPGMKARGAKVDRTPVRRRYAVIEADQGDVSKVERATGTTTEAVALGLIADGLRGGIDDGCPKGRDMHASVPIRFWDGQSVAIPRRGMRVVVSLRGDIDDTLERIVAIGSALELEALAAQSNLAQIARLRSRFSPPLIRLVRVPAPMCPMCLLGSRARTIFAIPPLTQESPFTAAVMTYSGVLRITLAAELDTATPDIVTAVARTARTWRRVVSGVSASAH